MTSAPNYPRANCGHPGAQFIGFSSFCVLRVWLSQASPALLYARTGASWWLFAALWLVPDLSMLGYLAGPCQGARIYNAVHSYVAPGALGACCAATSGNTRRVANALIWANHIGGRSAARLRAQVWGRFGFTHQGQWEKSEPDSGRVGLWLHPVRSPVFPISWRHQRAHDQPHAKGDQDLIGAN